MLYKLLIILLNYNYNHYPSRVAVPETNAYAPLALLYVVVYTDIVVVRNSVSTNYQLYPRQSILV